MTASEAYAKLRDRCVRYWGFHPDCSGSVADLWDQLSRNSAFKTVGITTAPMIVAELAALVDLQRQELEALRTMERAVKRAVDALPGDKQP